MSWTLPTQGSGPGRHTWELRPILHTGRLERHGTPGDERYAVEHGGGPEHDDRTWLLVPASGRQPEPATTLRPRIVSPRYEYRVAGSDDVVEAEDKGTVPLDLSGDPNALVLEAVR